MDQTYEKQDLLGIYLKAEKIKFTKNIESKWINWGDTFIPKLGWNFIRNVKQNAKFKKLKSGSKFLKDDVRFYESKLANIKNDHGKNDIKLQELLIKRQLSQLRNKFHSAQYFAYSERMPIIQNQMVEMNKAVEELRKEIERKK